MVSAVRGEPGPIIVRKRAADTRKPGRFPPGGRHGVLRRFRPSNSSQRRERAWSLSCRRPIGWPAMVEVYAYLPKIARKLFPNKKTKRRTQYLAKTLASQVSRYANTRHLLKGNAPFAQALGISQRCSASRSGSRMWRIWQTISSAGWRRSIEGDGLIVGWAKARNAPCPGGVRRHEGPRGHAASQLCPPYALRRDRGRALPILRCSL
jgi:hypothetical protein